MQMLSGVSFALIVPSGPTVPVIGMNVPGHHEQSLDKVVISHQPELEEEARHKDDEDAGERAGGGHGEGSTWAGLGAGGEARKSLGVTAPLVTSKIFFIAA